VAALCKALPSLVLVSLRVYNQVVFVIHRILHIVRFFHNVFTMMMQRLSVSVVLICLSSVLSNYS
jgi:hypothetical protein